MRGHLFVALRRGLLWYRFVTNTRLRGRGRGVRHLRQTAAARRVHSWYAVAWTRVLNASLFVVPSAYSLAARGSAALRIALRVELPVLLPYANGGRSTSNTNYLKRAKKNALRARRHARLPRGISR